MRGVCEAVLRFFNSGVDTGTVWPSIPAHEPVLWRHVSWRRQSPDREVKEASRWGWLCYRRVKTGRACYRPMNRTVHALLKSVLPPDLRPDEPVFLGGVRGRTPGSRSCANWPGSDPGRTSRPCERSRGN